MNPQLEPFSLLTEFYGLIALMNPQLEPFALLTATAGLLAFLVGLYTLVGRERKAPYLINRVFFIFLLCLVGAAFDIAAASFPGLKAICLWIGVVFLLVAFAASVTQVYRIWTRFAFFVDVINPKHLTWVRTIRRTVRRLRAGPTYEHNPNPIPTAIAEAITSVAKEQGASFNNETSSPTSLAVAAEYQGQTDKLLIKLISLFLAQNYQVQYATASRHPVEFLKNLCASIGENELRAKASQIVVVDAFTPHFGFIDSIYSEKSYEVKELGVQLVRSKVSYAGVHTASSKAFNIVKQAKPSDVRAPALVIYEDMQALADLESAEQYRVFLRHVVPSERLWGGMFSVFIETAQPEADWRLLQSYTSMKLDFRGKEKRG
jgi:hypothetical protein